MKHWVLADDFVLFTSSHVLCSISSSSLTFLLLHFTLSVISPFMEGEVCVMTLSSAELFACKYESTLWIIHTLQVCTVGLKEPSLVCVCVCLCVLMRGWLCVDRNTTETSADDLIAGKQDKGSKETKKAEPFNSDKSAGSTSFDNNPIYFSVVSLCRLPSLLSLWWQRFLKTYSSVSCHSRRPFTSLRDFWRKSSWRKTNSGSQSHNPSSVIWSQPSSCDISHVSLNLSASHKAEDVLLSPWSRQGIQASSEGLWETHAVVNTSVCCPLQLKPFRQIRTCGNVCW